MLPGGAIDSTNGILHIARNPQSKSLLRILVQIAYMPKSLTTTLPKLFRMTSATSSGVHPNLDSTARAPIFGVLAYMLLCVYDG